MQRTWLLTSFVLVACSGPVTTVALECEGTTDGLAPVWYLDIDGDGVGDASTGTVACEAPANHVALSGDCDEEDAAVYAGAAEACDGVDNDCDGVVDEDPVDGAVYYLDHDGDGYGAAAFSVTACAAPSGHVADATDCDDSHATAHPGAVEVCDGVDNDCDDTVDEPDASDAGLYFVDGDGDGFGTGEAEPHCRQPVGYSALGGDCRDDDAEAFPGAVEICDGTDNNCDGAADVGAVDARLFFFDADQDGVGGGSLLYLGCTADPGFTEVAGDCDDSDTATYPGAPEQCDGADNDCDGVVPIDEADGDGDGWVQCLDCNDGDPQVNPSAIEICDGEDNNCDDVTDDDAINQQPFFRDVDDDTFGTVNDIVYACEVPFGYVSDPTDCDDTRGAVYPGAQEICDALDNDCDNAIDEEATDANTWYADGDADGFGNVYLPLVNCDATAPLGYAADATDCNDASDMVYPGADERCDGLDNDCDTIVDESDAIDAVTYYSDGDGDGYGGGAGEVFCFRPDGYSPIGNDCFDDDALSYPGAPELCDDKDNNCNTLIDEGALDANLFYYDGDGDGAGLTGIVEESCQASDGYVPVPGDCNDADALTFPGADERCDGEDNNCDGNVPADEVDADGDAFLACVECDDGNPQINPSALEICDGVDNNCDTVIDIDALDRTPFFRDVDEDQFGDAGNTTLACEAPDGFVADNTDCDDGRAAVYPGAPEICDTLDNDCNNAVDDGALDRSTFYADGDADGYGNLYAPIQTCESTPPNGYTTNTTDCNDSNERVFPGAVEYCDGLDNDCNPSTPIDENAVDGTQFYLDLDGDLFGDANDTVGFETCAASFPGFSSNNLDCNDDDPAANPSASGDECDGVDYNCDGVFECDDYGLFIPVTTPMTFADARQYCIDEFGPDYKLFEPVTSEQADWVFETMGTNAWLGVIDSDIFNYSTGDIEYSPFSNGGTRTWVYASDGDPITPGIDRWRLATNEPNNDYENCVVVFGFSDGNGGWLDDVNNSTGQSQLAFGLWNDAGCDTNLVMRQFICQLDQ
ncbi:MAG: MopE-related protein [Myxococcota bacterium]